MSVWRSIITFLVASLIISTGFSFASCNEKPEPMVEPTSSPQKMDSNETVKNSDRSLGKTKPVLQFLVGNENRANIANCGCGSVEPLSISRKSAALKRLQIEDVPSLSIERSYLSHPGNKETRKANEYQNKVYVQLLEMWNCDVLLPAGRDLYCTKDEFIDIHRDTSIPIVLTNVDLNFSFDNFKKSSMFEIAERRLLVMNIPEQGKDRKSIRISHLLIRKELLRRSFKQTKGSMMMLLYLRIQR